MEFKRNGLEHAGGEQGKTRRIDGKTVRELFSADVYNRPVYCKECGGVMIYKGVGEYKCEDCGIKDYDDYGKVRNYIEKHHGATAAKASEATGVSQKTIRTMLKESRLEIAPNSRAFLKCEMCGEDIRFGRFCSKCELIYHRKIEEKSRAIRNNMTGYGMEHDVQDGAKRFRRDK